jgi:netrin 1
MLEMKRAFLLVLVIKLASSAIEDLDSSGGGGGESDPCYDRITGRPQRCIPNFENIAYGKRVLASSTCGLPPINYCVQSASMNKPLGGSASSNKNCDKCDASVESSIRDTRYLTDLEETNTTCWVSGPIYDPTETANLTLHIPFNKKYELTYISLQFCSQLKPDSLSIMKSVDYGKTWVPFQYYSSECKKVFNRPLRAKVTQSNEQEAVCTDQHLQSSPFNTNRIGFSTLEGRPSFHDFDTSAVLQDWVTATDIKLVFNRLMSPVLFHNLKSSLLEQQHQLNLTGASGYHQQLKLRKHSSRHSRSQQFQQLQNFGYFYAALSEISIGGRCKCNGHASRCFLNK